MKKKVYIGFLAFLPSMLFILYFVVRGLVYMPEFVFGILLLSAFTLFIPILFIFGLMYLYERFVVKTRRAKRVTALNLAVIIVFFSLVNQLYPKYEEHKFGNLEMKEKAIHMADAYMNQTKKGKEPKLEDVTFFGRYPTDIDEGNMGTPEKDTGFIVQYKLDKNRYVLYRVTNTDNNWNIERY